MSNAQLTIELATALATYAHDGQTDKAGAPYIRHPLAVAASLTDPTDQVVGLLHDVLEDTDILPSTIGNLFGEEILQALLALTHQRGESYEAYIHRAGENPIARRVKLADLAHNMDLSRLPEITPADERRVQKYARARAYLLQLP